MRKHYLALLLLLSSFSAYASSGGGGGGENANNPYFEITTPFVVNIQDETAMRFLQVNAQLVLSHPELKAQITKNLPAIQNIMMLVLSEQNVKEIRTLEGKQKLRVKTLKEVQDLLQKEIGDTAVTEILFTGFIIQ